MWLDSCHLSFFFFFNCALKGYSIFLDSRAELTKLGTINWAAGAKPNSDGKANKSDSACTGFSPPHPHRSSAAFLLNTKKILQKIMCFQ